MTQVGFDGGKRVVCDLRIGLRNGLQQCALSGIRESNETYVGQKLKVQSNKTMLAFHSYPVVVRASALTPQCCYDLKFVSKKKILRWVDASKLFIKAN